MLKAKSIPIYILLITLLYQNIISQRISQDLFGGWGEKNIVDSSKDLEMIIDSTEKYLVSEGYSLEKYEVIPVGFFTQSNLGINYRLLCAVKKISDDTPTIFDIQLRKENDDYMKIISSNNPKESYEKLSEKEEKKMKIAIMKYYFDKLYKIETLEIQYEYHNINGLNKYAIYDVKVTLKNKEETTDKRILIIYRNDKTFTVENELLEK